MSAGVVLTEEAFRRMVEAVRWVERQRGLTQRPVAAESGVDPVFVRVTNATPDGNGNYEGVVTLNSTDGWVNYGAVKIYPANGETLLQNRRYLARPSGLDSYGDPLYTTGELTFDAVLAGRTSLAASSNQFSCDTAELFSGSIIDGGSTGGLFLFAADGRTLITDVSVGGASPARRYTAALVGRAGGAAGVPGGEIYAAIAHPTWVGGATYHDVHKATVAAPLTVTQLDWGEVVLSIVAASHTQTGALTHAAQTIGGSKTFYDSVAFTGSVSFISVGAGGSGIFVDGHAGLDGTYNGLTFRAGILTGGTGETGLTGTIP